MFFINLKRTNQRLKAFIRLVSSNSMHMIIFQNKCIYLYMISKREEKTWVVMYTWMMSAKYACKIRWMWLSFDFSCNCWWNAMPMRFYTDTRSEKTTCSPSINITSMHDKFFLLLWFKDFSSLLTKNISCANNAKASSLLISFFFSSALSFHSIFLYFWMKSQTRTPL